MSLIVFSKINCSQCDTLCNLLDTKAIEYSKKIFNNLFDLVSKEKLDEDSEEIVVEIGSFPILQSGSKLLSYQQALSLYDEPLIEENKNRFTIYPIQHHLQLFFQVCLNILILHFQIQVLYKFLKSNL